MLDQRLDPTAENSGFWYPAQTALEGAMLFPLAELAVARVMRAMAAVASAIWAARERGCSNTSYVFRGTTAGFPGSSTAQRIGVTPVTRDPLVGTAFSASASRHGGNPVVLVASRANLPMIEGNVLSALEAEEGVEMLPAAFEAQAHSISLEASRAALS